MFTEAQIAAALDAQGVVFEHTHRIHGTVAACEAPVVKRRGDMKVRRNGHVDMEAIVPPEYQPLFRAIAAAHCVTIDSMMNDSKNNRAVNARCHFAHEMRRRYGFGTPKIAKILNINHTAILYYHRKFARIIGNHAAHIQRVNAECP